VIVLPGKHLRVEFLLDKQQVVDVTVADTADIVNKTTFTGSPENTPYLQYQKFVSVKGKLLQAERRAYMQSTTRADSVLHEQKYNAYTKELNSYRENIIKNPAQINAGSLAQCDERSGCSQPHAYYAPRLA
jgi:hypothetical protein